MRAYILTLLLLTSGYGCAAIILTPVLPLPLFHPWFAWAVWFAAPPVLFITAIWASMKLRQYRMMDAMRNRGDDPASLLARGEVVEFSPQSGLSAPEALCRLLIVMALAAGLIWLGLPHPLLWLGTGAAFWMLIRWMLRAGT